MKSILKGVAVSAGLIFALSSSALAAKIEEGKTVKFDYVLTVEGEVLDTTSGKTPLEYVHGSGQIIPGLENALLGLEPGDSKKVTLQPEDAYGAVNPDAFTELPMEQFPEDFQVSVGMILQFNDPEGKPVPAVVTEVKETTVVVSFNHPLAGKVLNFDVTVVSVE